MIVLEYNNEKKLSVQYLNRNNRRSSFQADSAKLKPRIGRYALTDWSIQFPPRPCTIYTRASPNISFITLPAMKSKALRISQEVERLPPSTTKSSHPAVLMTEESDPHSKKYQNKPIPNHNLPSPLNKIIRQAFKRYPTFVAQVIGPLLQPNDLAKSGLTASQRTPQEHAKKHNLHRKISSQQ